MADLFQCKSPIFFFFFPPPSFSFLVSFLFLLDFLCNNNKSWLGVDCRWRTKLQQGNRGGGGCLGKTREGKRGMNVCAIQSCIGAWYGDSSKDWSCNATGSGRLGFPPGNKVQRWDPLWQSSIKDRGRDQRCKLHKPNVKSGARGSRRIALQWNNVSVFA